MKLLSKYNNVLTEGLGKVQRWYVADANASIPMRVETITNIASVCFGKDEAKKPEKLYNRLMNESMGLPSSSFEFVPILLKDNDFDYLGTMYEEDLDELKKFGEWVEDGEYLLTNLRALINVVGADEAKDFLNTSEEDMKIINENYFLFKLEVDIVTARQLIRHRLGNYQEKCVSGDTLIHTSKGKRRIKDLYEQQYKKYCDGRLPKVKTFDFKSKRFTLEPIKEVFKTGIKDVYEVTIQYGSNKYRIKTTKDHKFLTKNGWKRLKDIKMKEFLALNGQPIWRNKEWLKNRKEYYLSLGIGLKDWALLEGVNYNTIRKCHREKTSEDNKTTKQTTRYGMLLNVKYVGREETYDLEVGHNDHNYVANSIVVHNSRRYTKDVPTIYTPDSLNKVVVEDKFGNFYDIENYVDLSLKMYEEALKKTSAQEARYVLPLGLMTTIWVGGSKRYWKNFIALRTDKHTQTELRKFAEIINKEIGEEL